MSDLQDLKNHVFVEPSTVANRPFIVKLIKSRVQDARALSDDELLNGEGHSIAADICGALAWNSANTGVAHTNWLNAQDEPRLIEIMNVSGVLDADANNKETWHELFLLADSLQ